MANQPRNDLGSGEPILVWRAPGADVDVWAWTLDVAPEALPDLRAVLDDEERDRAGRFALEHLQRRYAAGRAWMRRLLARRLGRAPEQIAYTYNAFGKPSLATGDDLAFNLSHCDDLAVLAMGRVGRLGVDVERPRPVEASVAAEHFAPGEYSVLGTMTGDAWLQGFYRCWTRKEAIVKALGGGLSIPLKSFEVELAADRPAALKLIKGDDRHAWTIRHLDLAPDFIGAVAWRV
jgi:4'-phosphopantetheinyl transferase